jgi:hypothetical protein
VKRCRGPLALLLLLAAAGGGRAGFVFNAGNDDIAGNSSLKAPYANLTITADANTGKVIFDLALAGTNSGKFGNFGFNFNKAAGILTTDFTVKVTGPGGSATSWGKLGAGQLGVFGNFDEVIGSSSGQLLTSVQIELDFKSTTKYHDATVSNFVVSNDSGPNDPAIYFASHFFPTTGHTSGDPDFIGVVPAPTTSVLLASGGVCLGAVLLLRRRKPAVT